MPQLPRRQAGSFHIRAWAGAIRGMFDVPRRARFGKSANARPAAGAAGVSGVPRKPTDKRDGTYRGGPAGVSRPKVATVSELHGLPPEDSRKLCGQESSQMRIL